MGQRAFTATALLLSQLPLIQGAAQTKCATPEPTTDPMFSPGQIWSYRTRPEETNSTITILRVEKTPKLGTIVHIRVDDIRWKGCRGSNAPTSLQHAPFTRLALEESVKKQTGTVATLPDFDAGYRDWLTHCGGAYKIPIDQVMALNDAQFGASQGCR